MKSLLAVLTLASLSVFAGTTTYTVSGMHCGGCEKMITKAVCENAEMKSTYTSCKVKLIDEKKQVGQITFETTDTQKIDQTQVQTLLSATDDGYKIIPNLPLAKAKKK